MTAREPLCESSMCPIQYRPEGFNVDRCRNIGQMIASAGGSGLSELTPCAYEMMLVLNTTDNPDLLPIRDKLRVLIDTDVGSI